MRNITRYELSVNITDSSANELKQYGKKTLKGRVKRKRSAIAAQFNERSRGKENARSEQDAETVRVPLVSGTHGWSENPGWWFCIHREDPTGAR